MSYIKKSCLVLSLTLLAGCVGSQTSSADIEQRQATGSNAGKVVVFALDNLGDETVGVSFNEHFMAPLQANKQFTQSICSGSYNVEARSVNAFTTGKKVERVKTAQFVQIAPQHTTYLEVSRSGNGWAVQEVSPEEWQMKSVTLQAGESGQNTKIVRRLTSQMLKCN